MNQGATREYRGPTYRELPELGKWAARLSEAPLEPDLPIVDPHHHLWDDERGRYLIDEFLADVTPSGHNVVATIFLQFKAMYRADGPEALKPVGEIEFANGLAAASASGRYGKIRVAEAIVGHADLLHGDEVQHTLEAMVAAGNGRLRGIRHGAQWDDGAIARGRTFPPRHMLLDPAFRKGFAKLAPLGLSFDAWQYYTQLPELIDLLRAFPDTQVILNHVGGILGLTPHVDRQAVFETWRARIRELATFPNLAVKLGGLGMLNCGWEFHFEDMPPSSETLAGAWRPYIETCIETFGAQRCMFESNFPVDKQTCGYGALWNAFKRITAKCSADEKAALYHDTAVRVYRLPRAALR